jgi:Coenzyme F420-reducing hydrogenase, beta subunit
VGALPNSTQQIRRDKQVEKQMIKILDKKECCGCEACIQVCPKQCIVFDEDSEGFRYPKVDESVCIDCGACKRTCPILSPYENRKPLSLQAAINPDISIRKQSSSGGLFTMLAERVIRDGGVVFGVRFDKDWQAVFDYTESIDGLAAFRGSKYVQARVGNAFTCVKDFLKEGRKVLFTGTSCQVAALRHFLHLDFENLLLVDIVCHGVPSPKVWRLYLNEVTQNAVRAISDVQFRNKNKGGKSLTLI